MSGAPRGAGGARGMPRGGAAGVKSGNLFKGQQGKGATAAGGKATAAAGAASAASSSAAAPDSSASSASAADATDVPFHVQTFAEIMAAKRRKEAEAESQGDDLNKGLLYLKFLFASLHQFPVFTRIYSSIL